MSTQLLGVRGDGSLVWLERTTPSGAQIRATAASGGAPEVLARTSGDIEGWLEDARETYGWREVPEVVATRAHPATCDLGDGWTLRLLREPALSGYGAVHLELRLEGHGARIGTIVDAGAAGLTIGALRVHDGHVLVDVRHGEVRSVRVFPLREAEVRVLNGIAIRHLDRGEPRAAAAYLERAAAEAPGSPETLYNLACVHARIGNLDRAEAELMLALGIAPLRMRRLARSDPDLASLRERESVRRRLWPDPRVD